MSSLVLKAVPPEEFKRPTDITVDAKGNIYVVIFAITAFKNLHLSFHKLKMNENSLARPSGFENLTSILSCPLCRRTSEEIVPPDT